jgi:hypothetical protein
MYSSFIFCIVYATYNILLPVVSATAYVLRQQHVVRRVFLLTATCASFALWLYRVRVVCIVLIGRVVLLHYYGCITCTSYPLWLQHVRMVCNMDARYDFVSPPTICLLAARTRRGMHYGCSTYIIYLMLFATTVHHVPDMSCRRAVYEVVRHSTAVVLQIYCMCFAE